MALTSLALPAGFRKVGTDLESAGRWLSGSLVRWRDGSLRPIGGWRVRIDGMVTDAPRGSIAWQDNSLSRWIAVGTFDALKVATSAGVISDITPVDLTGGELDGTVNTGFGGGTFGTGFFGVARPDMGEYAPADTWSMDTFGQYLIACSTSDRRILEWQLNTGVAAAVVANSPACDAITVTADRTIFALGAGGNPRRIEWCDVEDNTTWTAASDNLAGGQTLQTTGAIQCGIRASGQTLILTDQDAHSATFVGQPFVYSFERVGTSCGVISRKAVAGIDGGVMWMGKNGFYSYSGAAVSPVNCDVHDHIFSDINTGQISKCWAMSIGQQGEVWFFYPSAESTECDRYVAYDYKEGHWLVGDMARTTGFDTGVFASPIMAGSAGDIYDHETGYNYDSGAVYAESGPSMIGAGDKLAVVTRVIPDELTLGDVSVTFKSRLYPTSTETTHGPYSAAEPTSVRFTGRQVRMRVEGQELGAWRVGAFRAEIVEGSKR